MIETYQYVDGNLVNRVDSKYRTFDLVSRYQEYKFHRSPRGVETLAKINYAPYTNQWIDENGNHYVPEHGQYACGPTSAMMAVSSYNKIPSGYASLRDFVFNDTPWILNGIPQKTKTCGKYQGAFSQVMKSCDWLATDWNALRVMYQTSFGLSRNEVVYEWKDATPEKIYNDVKTVIDQGALLQSGISIPGVGHQTLLIGYGVQGDIYWNTVGIADSVISNDPFTDLTTDDNHDGAIDRDKDGWTPYSTNGKGAIYKVGINGIQLGRNYLIIIKKMNRKLKFLGITVFILALLIVSYITFNIFNKENFPYKIDDFTFYSNKKLSIEEDIVLDTKYYTVTSLDAEKFTITFSFRRSEPVGVFTGINNVTGKLCNLEIEDDNMCYDIATAKTPSGDWRISFYELDTLKDLDMDIKNNADPNAPYLSYPPDKYLRDYQMGDWFDKYFKILDYDYSSLSIYIDRKYEKDSPEFNRALEDAVSVINDISKAKKISDE